MATHDVGANDGEHDWWVASHVFPDSDAYEHEYPYAVLNCDCGNRKTQKMSADEIEQVREIHALPAETVVSADEEGA